MINEVKNVVLYVSLQWLPLVEFHDFMNQFAAYIFLGQIQWSVHVMVLVVDSHFLL